MRWSQTFIPTLREDPAGISHPGLRMLVRGGYLRRVDAEDYLYLPLLNRVREKLKFQLGLDLANSGADCIDLTVDNRPSPGGEKRPAHTGDSREIICRTVNRELRSYRQLPLALYCFLRRQLRDSRLSGGQRMISEHEWLEMHIIAASASSLRKTQDRLLTMLTGYLRRYALAPVVTLSENGGRGLFIPTETNSGGESVLSCNTCDYAAMADVAESRPEGPFAAEDRLDMERVATPGAKTVDEVTAFLGIGAERLIKTLLYRAGEEIIGALVRGDRTVNEDKLRRVAGVAELQLLEAPDVRSLTGAAVGFSGPVGLRGVRLYADNEIPLLRNAVVGGNADDVHLINVNPDDFTITRAADIREVADGDRCPRCADGLLQRRTGWTVGGECRPAAGNSPMVMFDDEDGTESQGVISSCYLDLTGLLLTIAEIHQDERGLKWPEAVAPYHIQVMAVNPENDEQWTAIENLEHALLSAGVEVFHDDRRGRIGGRFKDADLLGVPLRVIVGPQGLKQGRLDLEQRQDGKITKLEIPRAVEYIVKFCQQKRIAPVTH